MPQKYKKGTHLGPFLDIAAIEIASISIKKSHKRHHAQPTALISSK